MKILRVVVVVFFFCQISYAQEHDYGKFDCAMNQKQLAKLKENKKFSKGMEARLKAVDKKYAKAYRRSKTQAQRTEVVNRVAHQIDQMDSTDIQYQPLRELLLYMLDGQSWVPSADDVDEAHLIADEFKKRYALKYSSDIKISLRGTQKGPLIYIHDVTDKATINNMACLLKTIKSECHSRTIFLIFYHRVKALSDEGMPITKKEAFLSLAVM
ncbi:hypothetical protein QQ020_35090 [Fulvivirgaceae bacterium BMA12]|uniref:Uncharacterized protein n=1 Tax=Agaribacillus aureus TaxID=3051825 RepID=A0ABT8LLZ2_9BACT|nr:hypothetical protein [Fulvivirgaceae bacterium BMA12]